MKNSVELQHLHPNTSSFRHIKFWKRRLRGTIITSVDGKPIHSETDIMEAISDARKKFSQSVRVEFGSLAGFAMNGEGIPTLQADQLNVIAHHLTAMNTNCDVWKDKTD